MDRRLALKKRLGELGRQRVRERFLLPRMLLDELRLFAALSSGSVISTQAAAPGGASA